MNWQIALEEGMFVNIFFVLRVSHGFTAWIWRDERYPFPFFVIFNSHNMSS